MSNIGNKIKELREKLNMSAKDLSLKSNVGQSTISEIETGKAKNPKMDTLQKLADALNVTVNDLLSTEEKLNIMTNAMKEIKEMAKKGVEYNHTYNTAEQNMICDPACGSSGFIIELNKLLKNYTLTEDEGKETISYIEYLISKRKK